MTIFFLLNKVGEFLNSIIQGTKAKGIMTFSILLQQKKFKKIIHPIQEQVLSYIVLSSTQKRSMKVIMTIFNSYNIRNQEKTHIIQKQNLCYIMSPQAKKQSSKKIMTRFFRFTS